MRVRRSQAIETNQLVCPYCMHPVSSDIDGHCGESSGHFEYAWEIDGDLYLESELEWIEPSVKEDACQE